MISVSSCLLQRNALSVDDVDWFVPLQANLRIVHDVARGLAMPMERVMVNLNRYGDTSAASVPICLSGAYEQGTLHPGARVLLAGFGSGFTSAAVYLRWLIPTASNESN